MPKIGTATCVVMLAAAASLPVTAPGRATAATELTHTCYRLAPFADTLRLMRIKTDFPPPGMQAVFARWRGIAEGKPYQLLGSGTVTKSFVDSTKRNLGITLTTAEHPNPRLRIVGLFAVLDLTTDTGPFDAHATPAL
jgi:hypothetical protein